ncbi:glutathione S-transferase [Photobacterium frigidiphilum]|uniref:Glutathione S-transferase n=1 Tax=Photobacterium frigidiphilum TaxID=264736 RepID=A0A2T3JGT2_9GAMM|nr:glutathione S-transferase [Photobacterium frigidiphilum]PSU48172.1 glutathione S-transferase [Photobacterium frigidiphilum]
MPHPILYSFRRCPYAMRARMGLLLAKRSVMLREILLKNKPADMLAASEKGTVPVLILNDGSVIDESLDIMQWALQQNDPANLLCIDNPSIQSDIDALIATCDGEFKGWLDKYKYADRHPDFPEEYYRQQGMHFLNVLEERLSTSNYLMGTAPTLADYAIFPFIRQFAHVDRQWFEQSSYPKIQDWLAKHLKSDVFSKVMAKYPLWLDHNEAFLLE